jgi:hypothetical protein
MVKTQPKTVSGGKSEWSTNLWTTMSKPFWLSDALTQASESSNWLEETI